MSNATSVELKLDLEKYKGRQREAMFSDQWIWRACKMLEDLSIQAGVTTREIARRIGVDNWQVKQFEAGLVDYEVVTGIFPRLYLMAIGAGDLYEQFCLEFGMDANTAPIPGFDPTRRPD